MYLQKIPFYFANVFLHLIVYFIFTIAPFKKDMRFSLRKTALITFVVVMFFCISDILVFEDGSPFAYLKGVITFITLGVVVTYGLIIVKKHYFQLMFIVIVCMIFHVNFISLSKTILFYYPAAPLIKWFPAFNDLLLQFLILLIFLFPMWYLSSKLFTKVLDDGLDFLEWKFTVLLPLFIYGLSEIYNVYLMTKLSKGYESVLIILFFMVTCYFGFLSILKILLVSNDKHLVEEKNAVASKQIELQKAKTTQLNQFILSSARERHDSRQHFFALKGFLDCGDLEKAKDYLNLYDKTHDMSYDKSVCENKTIDALLIHNVALAKELKIRLTMQVNVPDKIGVDELDLCVVVGNIVENAIEACKRQKNENKFINIRANTVGKQFVFIVTNSYEGEIYEKNGEIYSSKEKNRIGIGIDSVKKVVNNNGGSMNIEYEGGNFKVYIVLNLD